MMTDQNKNKIPLRSRGFSLEAVWNDILVAWKLLWDKRVPFLTKLIVPFALLYTLSPLDFLPDFIVGIGQVDDLTLIVLALTAFLKLAPKPVVEELRLRVQGIDPATVIDPHTVIIDQPGDQDRQ